MSLSTPPRSEADSDFYSTNYEHFLSSILHVTVNDCRFEGEGLSQVLTYVIQTIVEKDGVSTVRRVVRRRHRDFVWLHENLASWSSGSILPPPPNKIIDGVFHNVSTVASDYHIELLEFMKQQGIVFARIWDYSEEEKMKFYLALQNFYTVNLKKTKDAGQKETKKVDKYGKIL